MTEMHSRPGEKPGPETGELCLDRRFRRPRLTPSEASDYLAEVHGTPVAVATLAKWRCQKSDGPRFDRFGRAIVYKRDDLDAWVAGRLDGSLRSTSDDGGGR